MTTGRFYLLMCVVGAIAPWAFFGPYFAANEFNVIVFAKDLFANGAAAGFSIDVVISIAVFWVWSFIDARNYGVKHWWCVLVAGCCVGLSLALPLYLYMRVPYVGATGRAV